MLKQLKNKKKKGFTLIELVIVLAVLAIIALIAIPNFTKVKERATQQANEVNIKQVENITRLAVSEGILQSVAQNFDIEIDDSQDANKTLDRVKIGVGVQYGFNNKSTQYSVADLKARFVDVQKPQGKGENGYHIKITGDGIVTAEAKTVTIPGAPAR